MRKLLALMSAGLLVLGVAACGETPSSASTSGQMVGAYTEERDLTEEDRVVFDEATDGIVGVEYEPLKVATQVVNGTNYRFYTKATTVTQEPEEKYVYVYIFKPLNADEKPTISEIVDVE